mmetsp:Transcript_49138/g.93864  ORF Transcript_49138/g.93864 Transcript_49138/m.93864 type:complete len:200 (-) Transcript_49138:675-1274(-)
MLELEPYDDTGKGFGRNGEIPQQPTGAQICRCCTCYPQPPLFCDKALKLTFPACLLRCAAYHTRKCMHHVRLSQKMGCPSTCFHRICKKHESNQDEPLMRIHSLPGLDPFTCYICRGDSFMRNRAHMLAVEVHRASYVLGKVRLTLSLISQNSAFWRKFRAGSTSFFQTSLAGLPMKPQLNMVLFAATVSVGILASTSL